TRARSGSMPGSRPNSSTSPATRSNPNRSSPPTARASRSTASPRCRPPAPKPPESAPSIRLAGLAQFVLAVALFRSRHFPGAVEVAGPPGAGHSEPKCSYPPGDAEGEPTGARKQVLTLHFRDRDGTEKHHDHESNHIGD